MGVTIYFAKGKDAEWHVLSSSEGVTAKFLSLSLKFCVKRGNSPYEKIAAVRLRKHRMKAAILV
jgi:hypothetical protein